MNFDGGELAKILMALHSLTQDQAGALEARLKHMQRLAFPRIHEDRRGKKISYTFGEVILIVFAFRIMETGASSVHAFGLVARSKAAIGNAVEQAWARRSTRTRSKLLLSYRPRVLSTELGRGGQADIKALGNPLLLSNAKKQSSSASLKGDPLLVVIDAGALVESLRSLIVAMGRYDDELSGDFDFETVGART